MKEIRDRELRKALPELYANEKKEEKPSHLELPNEEGEDQESVVINEGKTITQIQRD